MSDNKEEVIEPQNNANNNDQSLEIDLNLQLTQQKEELTKQKENYLRIIADYENRMRRNEQDAAHSINMALEKIAKDMIVLLNDLSQAMHLCIGPTKDGIEMIYKNFKSTLSKHGIQEINPNVGDDFDANMHEAIDQQTKENFEPGKIIQIIQTGYKLKQKIIIPCSVIISN